MNAVVACVVVSLLMLPAAQIEVSCPVHPPAQEATTCGAEYSLEGTWQLRWNDELGAAKVEGDKVCNLRLRADGDRLVGEFVGPVAGTQRDAEFTGMLHRGGEHCLLTLEQREAGYVCCYQLSWPADKGFADAVSVWHDTRGGRGSFAILKYQ